ncbi:hypothetical protein SUGI_1485510 [Cryptomeria japonica]|uniref:Uncharacterized protein n=1 Tax=Cryptomeria japonica TaxID=3369 RepID=A0AAD3RPN0_CRYJA|nr:hypothetical protein SUGI_1485510 [Cryptomeria japonica]
MRSPRSKFLCQERRLKVIYPTVKLAQSLYDFIVRQNRKAWVPGFDQSKLRPPIRFITQRQMARTVEVVDLAFEWTSSGFFETIRNNNRKGTYSRLSLAQQPLLGSLHSIPISPFRTRYRISVNRGARFNSIKNWTRPPFRTLSPDFPISTAAVE